jgi:hypothetical protein
MRRRGTDSDALRLQTDLLAAIGVGSALFHLCASRWSQILDVLPILALQTPFVWCYARQIVVLNRLLSTVIAVFLVGTQVSLQYSETLNGLLSYLPSLVMLFAAGIYHLVTCKCERFSIILAATVFLPAVILRTIDLAVCGAIPIGTHFLWHLLSALVLYLAMRGLVLNWPQAAHS